MRTVRIVVADQSQARLFDSVGDRPNLRIAGVMSDPAARKLEQNLVSDAPGSSITAGGHVHYSMPEKKSRKSREVAAFAKHIAERLASDASAGQFDELAIIAGPRFLGILRKALPADLHKRVKLEVHHDLVHGDEAAIRAHLPDHW
jgi:protein required for attachment to host cells